MTAMAEAADLFPRAATPRHGVQAVIVTAPADENDTLDAGWDADGDDGAGEEQVVETGVRWASNGRLPATGDTAILFNDDRGDPWALVHATGDVIT